MEIGGQFHVPAALRAAISIGWIGWMVRKASVDMWRQKRCPSSNVIIFTMLEFRIRPRGSVALTTRHSLSAKLTLTSPTSGSISVGIVRSRSKATEFVLFVSNWGSRASWMWPGIACYKCIHFKEKGTVSIFICFIFSVCSLFSTLWSHGSTRIPPLPRTPSRRTTLLSKHIVDNFLLLLLFEPEAGGSRLIRNIYQTT
jgi:hypothetical protein